MDRSRERQPEQRREKKQFVWGNVLRVSVLAALITAVFSVFPAVKVQAEETDTARRDVLEEAQRRTEEWILDERDMREIDAVLKDIFRRRK